jgi:hypothetical protein
VVFFGLSRSFIAASTNAPIALESVRRETEDWRDREVKEDAMVLWRGVDVPVWVRCVVVVVVVVVAGAVAG